MTTETHKSGPQRPTSHSDGSASLEQPDSNRETRGFYSSGTSPTLHLIGAGQVGRALLRLLKDEPFRLVAVSDSSATAYAKSGLDPNSILLHKQQGGALRDYSSSETLPLKLVADLVRADLVVDVTPTDPDHAHEALSRCLAILRTGSRLISAAKAALLAAPGELLQHPRFGSHAVLGGTGALLQQQLTELQATTQSIALVGNASTTAVIERVERGKTFDAAIAEVQRLGILEPDPELDLRGHDATVKLAIVANGLWPDRVAFDRLQPQHLLDVDANQLRQRYENGATTRLVARCDAAGQTKVGYEEVARASVLATPSDRVAYTYQLADGEHRVHVGRGIGPIGTARALLADLQRLADQGGAS